MRAGFGPSGRQISLRSPSDCSGGFTTNQTQVIRGVQTFSRVGDWIFVSEWTGWCKDQVGEENFRCLNSSSNQGFDNVCAVQVGRFGIHPHSILVYLNCSRSSCISGFNLDVHSVVTACCISMDDWTEAETQQCHQPPCSSSDLDQR